jgi:succinyl-CoA synthetase alpha subunit
VHVGGDVIVGLTFPKIARLFENDPETRALVFFGEIGGSQEEQLANLIQAGEITKPVIAYIGGKAAKSGTRFSHAGAIVEGNRGTYQGKVTRLREAGAVVVDAFGELPEITASVLKSHGIRIGGS